MIRNKSAFSLVELLIASAIFVVVMVAVYSAMHAGMFGYKNIEENLDFYQAARQIIGRIDLDLRDAFIFGDSNNYTGFSGDNSKISFFTLVDTFSSDSLKQDIAFVSYESEDNKLLRLCRKNGEAFNENSEIPPDQMMQSAEIKFSYGFLPAGRQEIIFKDNWALDSDKEKKALPCAVKVSLTLKGKTEQIFTRTIYLPLAG